ncbi:MAG: aspartate--tRNA(Asn) ligase [Candidatus Kapaibacterium sp.]
MNRTFVAKLGEMIGEEVTVRGWVFRLRELAKVTFLILHDATGMVQSVANPAQLDGTDLKLDDVVEIRGRVRSESRSKVGFELDLLEINVLNRSAFPLPFNSSSNLAEVPLEVQLDHRPLSLRNPVVGNIFRVQGEILQGFREFLREHHFTEIVSSKIVAGGTEGGTNLFEIDYFDRAAYLAQSPQFYKEHGVAGFERVFETGHVYRAEPHATSRHLTEYYSLDFEMGFIDGPEDVIALERELLTYIFNRLNEKFGEMFIESGVELLPSMLEVPTWEFGECLERLSQVHGRNDLVDDLDPEAERQLCAIAEQETGVPALFVLGFPLANRPFYTHPRGSGESAESFDLLFRGLEITTGGQRLHRREDLESALHGRGIDPTSFEPHLRMFGVGMPPHGGLAIGLERLTMLITGQKNVREATMYPRDRNRVSP